ncbi:MAG: SpaA isopeptide-forming pilin-related protein [Oscillospiraceae bacterium]|nr:SpaA isopeptide-forming pilin-related protein [Oscillospiraceae bacterium]
MNKLMANKIFKRMTAVLLVVVVMIGTFAVLPVNAVGKSVTVTFDYCYDTAGNIIKYVQKTTAPNGTTVGTVGEELCRIYVDGKDAYCIEPGVHLMSGDTVTEDASTVWRNLGSAKQKAINLALLYGKSGNSSNMSGTAGQQWIATQLIIWEFVTGCRSTSDGFKCTDKRFYNGICGGDSNTGVQTNYNKISTLLAEYSTVPSFASVLKSKADTYEMKYKDGEYSVTLKDENKVLDEFKFKATDGVKVSVSGNKLTLTSSKPVDNEVTFTSAKKMPSVSSNSQLIAYGSSYVQDVISGVEPESDPVKAYFSVKTLTGNLKLKKTSEDGIAEGIKFTVTGTDYSKTVTTDKEGTFTLTDLVPGTYTVTETVATRYAEQESKTVKVEFGKTATVSFSNVLKKWRVKVTKVDVDTTIAQGDATLSGAVYGVYDDGKLIDKYTTNSKGEFTTSYYNCGANWTIKEITPSEGYLLDKTEYHIGAEAKKYTIENNSISMGVTEDILKGKISVIKHTDDGSTKIETPEKGAEFQVYLKSSGSYAKAKESERDTLICDEYGFAETKDLPYGTYTVHQTKGWNGTEFIADFDVFVNEDGKTYKYLINNASLESYVKIVKIDSETGKQIPYAGAGFQIYNPDGKLVTMKYTYPTVTEIDTFYTNSEGYLITPETLPCGKGYSVVEVQAPYGYILDSTPVYFDITAENTTEENGVTIVKTEKKNTPQKGTITVEKTGESFSNVTLSGEKVIIYQPEYSASGLAGAVFEIYADEDIITPDGTVRYTKDTLVDTITTGEKGTATSKQLYLSKYRVVEKTAPYGFVLNSTVNHIELTYAGQNEKVTNTSTLFTNDRQKFEIDLTKVLEQNEKFNIGNNDEILNVSFGLYADEDLKATNGTVIPKDGLLEIITCDEKGKATFTTDIPSGSYYVKEVSTDSHYILSEKKHPVLFEYVGQDTATVHISVNDGEPIENEIIYGTIKGLKIDRETGENIACALFGLFSTDETEFTKETAILTAESNEGGVFEFTDVPYGEYIVRELKPAEGYLPNEENYQATVSEDEEIIEITVENDKIPELKTTATVDGKKEFTVNGDVTIDDVVSYKHLIPGKKYIIKGILMDKKTGKAFLVDGKEVCYEVTFTPETADGEVTVSFTFDGSAIIKDTEIVVFETLYREKTEIAVHADIDDKNQTVTIHPQPEPEKPQTGDNSNLGFWIGLGAVALGGLVSVVIIKLKKKDEDEE